MATMPTSWPLAELTVDDQAKLARVARRVTIEDGQALIVAGESSRRRCFSSSTATARVDVRGREIARVGPGGVRRRDVVRERRSRDGEHSWLSAR